MCKIIISKAPNDPEKKKEWANSMMRIQLEMYVHDKATCAQCGHTYTSVDDMIRCNPKSGGLDKQKNFIFVCSSCWPKYAAIVRFQDAI